MADPMTDDDQFDPWKPGKRGYAFGLLFGTWRGNEIGRCGILTVVVSPPCQKGERL